MQKIFYNYSKKWICSMNIYANTIYCVKIFLHNTIYCAGFKKQKRRILINSPFLTNNIQIYLKLFDLKIKKFILTNKFLSFFKVFFFIFQLFFCLISFSKFKEIQKLSHSQNYLIRIINSNTFKNCFSKNR